MRPLAYLIILCVATRLLATPPRQNALPAMSTLEQVAALSEGAKLSDFDKIGEASGMDIGSSRHQIIYALDDGSRLQVVAELSGGLIITITLYRGEKVLELYPKPKPINQKSPNHAL